MRYVGERRIVIDGAPTPVPFWSPDRSFDGLAVVIVGGGPSHAAIDLDVLRGHRFVAINSACRKVRPIATPADALYFTDNSWNERRPELAAGWPGLVISSNRNVKARLGDAVRRIDIDELTLTMQVRPDFAQASSGHSGACLAAIMGARRLVLVGFEARAIDGRTHGHIDYTQPEPEAFKERFIPGWRALAPQFARLGVEVINATPESAVDCFPFRPLAEALA